MEGYDYYASGDYDLDKEEARSEEEHALAEYQAEKEQLAFETGETPVAQCQICGRPLSDPASIAAGMGPICAGKFPRRETVAERHTNVMDMKLDDPPLTQRLILQRLDTGRVATNVPHIHVHHSPSGFEYGYGGSGPADLALNLAEFVVNGIKPDANAQAVKLWDGSTCTYEAWIIHHDLKFKLLSGLKQSEDYRVPYVRILRMVKEFLDMHKERIDEHYAIETAIREVEDD